MFYLNKTLKNELNETYIELKKLNSKTNLIEKILNEYTKKTEEIETGTEHQEGRIRIIENTIKFNNKYNSKKLIQVQKNIKNLEEKITIQDAFKNGQSKINEETAKKYKMLLNGLNETRLAVQTIAKILQEKNMLKLKEENNDARKTSDKRK